MKAFPAIIGESIERFRFREASQELMNLARLGNKYLADQEPWKLIKVDPERVETIMNIALQIAATLATVSEPFLPHSAQKLRTILNITNPTEWNAIATTENLLVAGHLIGSQELLFAKVEDSNIQAQLDKLEATKKNNADADFELTPVKENISFEQFNAMDLRTGTVVEAEKIKKTKKLLKLKVDLGFEIRTIVSGIAASYTPEEMLGKKVTVLANLGSRSIKGVESQGMLLMTENKEGKLIVIGPEDASMDNGFEIN
jgi:methionyl-tRNA synthetase